MQRAMDKFAAQTGRAYHLFDYYGDPKATRVIVLMGSGCETAQETVDYLTKQGEHVGLLKVRLYRPLDMARFVAALPPSTTSLAVLDRTKEPGAAGEPLYQDVLTALRETGRQIPVLVGGRYGLSSKEFTPAMVKAVFDNLAASKPKNHFTVGINDDVTHTSLDFDAGFSTESDRTVRAVFYGLGADGTVGANKNSIKIIGEDTDNYAQGYFVYDSKKSGSTTVSHLRFGPEPIRSTYLVTQANFVACHQPIFVERYDILKDAIPGGTFLLNTPYSAEEIWGKLPRVYQEHIVAKKLKMHVIDAVKVARESGMGGRINTVMQVCFFAISGVLPRQEAIDAIKQSIKKTYGKKGEEIVQMNLKAVDNTLAHLHEVKVPSRVDSQIELPPSVSAEAPEFVRTVLGEMIAGCGDRLPVSQMPCDGTFPLATSRWEKRNIALEIPVWDSAVCIQCGKCAMVCPHAVIRAKAYEPNILGSAPATFKVRGRARQGMEGPEVHDPGCSRRLHGLRVVRGRLSRQEQERAAAESDQHGGPAAATGARGKELGLLPQYSRNGSAPDQGGQYPPPAVAAAVVRVQRRVCGLRRNPLCETGQPVVRRPGAGRQRHRLLVDLRR